jgi:hypothetical protein
MRTAYWMLRAQGDPAAHMRGVGGERGSWNSVCRRARGFLPAGGVAGRSAPDSYCRLRGSSWLLQIAAPKALGLQSCVAAPGRLGTSIPILPQPPLPQTGLSTPPSQHSTDRAFLRKWKWSQVVMDEAHALKNAASSRARRLRRLAQVGHAA